MQNKNPDPEALALCLDREKGERKPNTFRVGIASRVDKTNLICGRFRFCRGKIDTDKKRHFL